VFIDSLCENFITMTKEDLKQLTTREDLQQLEKSLIERIKKIVTQINAKEFYTVREFAETTAMGYSNVLKYCQDGKIKARQDGTRGSWVIHREEVERYIEQAQNNISHG